VQERLPGSVRRPDGTVVAGPKTPAWKGLNKPHRQHRRSATARGPEQISNRLKAEFPDDEAMRISHEAIYQALFIEGRGVLKRELAACCARAARCGSHGHDRGTSRKALSPQTL
jgi:hypothetical protein